MPSIVVDISLVEYRRRLFEEKKKKMVRYYVLFDVFFRKLVRL